MRFNKYLGKNINKFRSYTIKLTDKYTKNINEVEKIINDYNLNSDIIKMIDGLNINFRKNQLKNFSRIPNALPPLDLNGFLIIHLYPENPWAILFN